MVKVGADGLLYHDHSFIIRDQVIIIVDPCFLVFSVIFPALFCEKLVTELLLRNS